MTPRRSPTRAQPPARARSSGEKIFRNSLLIGAVGVAPLLLYILLGPSNGNPIGLGLLAVVAVPAALIGMAIGGIKILMERYAGAKR